MPIVWQEIGSIDLAVVEMPEVPACLRREPTPESRALVARIVEETREGKPRDWVMPKPMTEGERFVAKYNQLIVDPTKPVEVFRYDAGGPPGGDPVFVRTFDSLDDFQRWYKGPPVHRDLGCKSTGDATSVLLDIAGNPNLAPPSLPKAGTVAKLPRMPKQSGAEGMKWYIVNSHVGMLLRAAGFVRVSTEQEEPLTFARGDDRCVIVPPALDKKSSSAWKLTLSGVEHQGVGQAIEDLLKGGKK